MNSNYKSNIIAKCHWQGFSAIFILAFLFVTTAFAQTPTLRANGKIAFTSDRDGNSEIYVMNADGSNQNRLTNNPAEDYATQQSPDLSTKFSFVSLATVNVANIEELYTAVNNPSNAGNQIVIAPGVYLLSANDPNGAARPNGGRLDLQENMSLQGVEGNRAAVVIDAANLPTSSYSAPPVANTGAIRMGRGINSVEWLTIRNAVNGTAGIETDIITTGTSYARIAHIISTGNLRGIDVRNFSASAANRVIQAEIVDNDLFGNQLNTGQGLRFTNNTRADGGRISATLSNNRSYNNFYGLILENVNSSLSSISVYSSGDRFYENGLGTQLGGALSLGANPANIANGNTTNFTAYNTAFENNNGFNPNDQGGLLIIGGGTYVIPNGASSNTVNATLRRCRFVNNQMSDISAFGARSNPESIGQTGTNNSVKIKLFGTTVPVFSTTDSVPANSEWMNFVTVTQSPLTPNFDFDKDGKSDISVFRPSDRVWYLNQSTNGFSATQFGLSTDKITPADYDGDGKTDISVYRDGVWYRINSSNGTVGIVQFGIASDIPVPADYSGDGRAELAIYRNGVWWSFDLNNSQTQVVNFGLSTDKPVVADYDGDGKADQAVYRGGEWHLNRSSLGYTVVNFGLSNDKPVIGDYDGDGKTDQAVYRNGTWYLLQSSNGFTAFQWGIASDIPAPADYDGDGKADAAVYRDGTWYLRQSTNGISVQQFGLANDKPAPSAFLP